ncbi:LysR family transcriptional regulator [Paraneptunicella aestuarii]|uniref:LysR family transcriptional regulator n=1 Tax=Paraneptunicella aestuarii TaxID=2831148 RepID=UPI001E586E92|nr:LysR family transcriptional regulator [Paraneptunicella aestuarii]UAA39866.1 LysR family transcriptional regulator [Paraneptunicella aestuarii]
MKQLSIDNLRAFVAVVELGGFAKAGEYLSRSQPAISLQIKRLEQQLDCKLFKREGQRQVPNQNGKELYGMAVELLKQNDHIFQHFEIAPLSGQIRLGIPSEFATTLLPNIIGAFNNAHPDVTLEVTSALSADLLKQHSQQAFDLLLVLGHQIHPDEQTITDRLVWVGPADNRPIEEQLSLVLAPDGCVYRRKILQELERQQKGWRISFTNSDLTGITAAIKEGLGITALARSTIPSELKEIESDKLPDLGEVSIHLKAFQDSSNNIAGKLAEFMFNRLSLLTR